MLVALLVVLFLYLLVFPFVLGMFDHGAEWTMYPTMYLNLWLLKVNNWGYIFKSFVVKTIKRP